MATVPIYSDFWDQKNKVCHCLHCLPTYLLWSDGTGCHDLNFLNVGFKANFFLSSFIKRLFNFLLSGIRMVSSAYVRLLIFLLAILVPGCASSSPAFLIMYSAYKLKQAGWHYTALTDSFPNLEPVCCPKSSSNCCFLTWIKISQQAGQAVWYSHLYQKFPQLLWFTQSKALA